MSDKEKILKKIHNEMDGLMDAQGNFEYPEHEGAYHALCNLEAYIDSLHEEPASEDFEEVWKNYFKYRGDVATVNIKDLALHFANWQKDNMMKDAIEGQVKIDADGYPYIDCNIELWDYDKDEPLAKKGDIVKIVVINNVK